MRPLRALSMLVLSALLAAGAGCDLGLLSPRDGARTGPDVAVDLWVPAYGTPTLRLDGQPVDLSDFEREGARLAGTLQGLEGGTHRLALRVQLFPGFSAWAESTIHVVDGALFEARGSVEQVFVTHALPGQELLLRDSEGTLVAEGVADDQGSFIFRDVQPGAGYRVVGTLPPIERSEPIEVMSVAGSQPPQEFYASQTLEPGYGYITMRDGTKLSVFVSLPGPVEEGPYPTVVNYSGYSPSKPGEPLELGDIDLSGLCAELPFLCAAPDHPSGLIAGALGYATVGVNMRGTGCSGGAFDFFETNQVLDGYDLIEIIAAQDWVRGNKVGMVGISYPGISQLYVAAAQPPSLAAISPLSVISGTDTTLAPGGIINDGFAIQWGSQVLDQADPYGQGWEQERVDAGDLTCADNQLLHSQKVDIIQKAYDNPYYTPEIYDPLNPRTFVQEIEVPVFTAGAWQDEQTGGHFVDLWDRFTNAPLVRMTGYNGAHADGYAPFVLAEWKNFLDFYVAGEITPIPELIQNFGPFLFQEIFGAPVGLLTPRFEPEDDFDQARQTYEAEQPVRIVFESGGGNAPGSVGAGAPEADFELFLDDWPPPGRAPERWYFHADGTLRPYAPDDAESASSFQHDDAKGAETYDVDDAFEKALPDIEWLPWQPGRQVVFASEPLAEDLTMLGFASADLWIRSTADDADLEVMISEIRPDGKEAYVTSGWLRASQRALAPESTALRPIPSRLEADTAPLPAGEWELVRVEVYPAAHVFRAGSRIRVSVSTPGGNKGRWKFDVLQLGEPVTHMVSHSMAHPSSILLPVMPGMTAPTPLPACPGLRGQPCRDYVPHTNTLLP